MAEWEGAGRACRAAALQRRAWAKSERGVLHVDTRFAEWGQIKADQIAALENSKASKEGLSRLQARVHEAEKHIAGIAPATEWQGRVATLEPRVAALEKICEDVDFPKVATHFDNKYDTALARIRALELKMHALEMEVHQPMADRTRSRKEARK